eukprot:TRINITY_DN14926_c0_g1_i1.p1 TRINITY_DN14926_c0_g1~~TRINITY_DN14926_c0_g1_i1.p1  ORF type:complete len:427 (-),score=37.57 TRINITY_DN14926_c0_g1_i1:199-1416(-)
MTQQDIPLDLLAVEQDLARELLCSICLQLLNNPRQCQNGHLFCFSCITSSLQERPVCPQCRIPILSSSSLSRNIFAENRMQNMQIHCKFAFKFNEDPLSRDPNGCQEIILFKDLSSHCKLCQYQPVVCPNDASCTPVRKNLLPQHLKNCPFRMTTCSYCHSELRFHKLEIHLPECPKFPLSCAHCKIKLTRQEMQGHSPNCPEEVIECAYKAQGCHSMVLRKDIEKHLKDEVGSHILLINSHFNERIDMLANQFKPLKEPNLLKEPVLQKPDVQVNWVIKNVSVLSSSSELLLSNNFVFDGFIWSLGVFPNGSSVPKHLSVILYVDKSSLKGREVSLDFSIKIIHPTRPNISIAREYSKKFPVPDQDGWGDSYETLNRLFSLGYLKNDTLEIESDISVKKIMFRV